MFLELNLKHFPRDKHTTSTSNKQKQKNVFGAVLLINVKKIYISSLKLNRLPVFQLLKSEPLNFSKKVKRYVALLLIKTQKGYLFLR